MAARVAPMALAMALAIALGGCSADETKGAPELETPLGAQCNPLSRDNCMLPWPSTFYLERDNATKTGWRLNYPAEAMPKTRTGKALDPTRYNLTDGASRGSHPMVFFRSGVSPEGLPKLSDPAASLAADSPIWLISFESGERVPFFAENDANGKGELVPALLIRPMAPFAANTRYVVVLRSSLRDAAGAPLKAPEGFARLRDGLPTADPTLEAQRARTEEIVAFLEQRGLARDDMLLAWDFHTASRESSTAQLISLVDQALAKLPVDGPAYTITSSTDHDDPTQRPHLWREIVGTFSVPSFLADDGPDATFELDASGKPTYRGLQDFAFRVHVPRCAQTATEPLPVQIFGHGLFGDAHGEMKGGLHRKLGDELCMVQVSATWHGLSSHDVGAVAAIVIPDFSKLPRVTDRLQQAQLNFHVLVELIRGQLGSDPKLQRGGKSMIDSDAIYYYGISNGGIQGMAFAMLQKHIKRFVLGVPGGWWSRMMERSSNFVLLGTLLEAVYPSAVDRAWIIANSQSLWDAVDPISWAGFHRDGPPPGRSAKLLLLHEGVHDDQVPNMTTRAVAREAGLKLLGPAAQEVYGITTDPGPLDSAYTQWDTDPPTVPPATNTPAAKPDTKLSAHQVPRRLVDLVEQLRRFMKPDGKVEQTCTGVCACTAEVDCKTIN
jgi:hypothetical protein